MKDITEYDLVIVGSGIQNNQWTRELEKILKKFQKELVKKKKVALSVYCGRAKPIDDRTDKAKSIENAIKSIWKKNCRIQPSTYGYVLVRPHL